MAGDGVHLNYVSIEVLLENIAFCLNNFLWNKASKNTEPFDQHFSIKHIDRGNDNCSKTDPCDTVEHLNELRVKNVNRLVICHLNINSLSNKFDQLKLIIKNKVDILVITETKLDSSFPYLQFIIDSFRQPYCLDRNKHGGGVMIFVSGDIPSKLVSKHILPNDIEGMFIEINLRKTKWLIFGTYYIPNQPDNYFFKVVGNALDQYLKTYGKFLLLGDLNAEDTEPILSEFLEQYEAKNVMKNKTCFKNPNRPTCIDLFLTNSPHSFQNTVTISTRLSDFHKMIIRLLLVESLVIVQHMHL